MIHVVLYEPEIPQNTGNIMRTCMASNCNLHLIEPLGFSLDEKHLRRSGMDYRNELNYQVYPNWQDFCEKNKGEFFYITRYGQKSPTMFDYNVCTQDIYLIFGKESTGIPKEILHDHQERCARLPMVANARSLNLSNCVAICVYEVLRQLNYPGLSPVEVIKGKDWLNDV
ncbi:MAG: tRNA (cytidine(34)-2'-O)-methyltransferase [Anaerorhabdus sp.]|uniref:tRNA (cytidine(34)-2'-O)-methyltransferase n=1 Tax=Anaerorhabdus sp. TaxID=1872524 RepID=UPI003A84C9D4